MLLRCDTIDDVVFMPIWASNKLQFSFYNTNEIKCNVADRQKNRTKSMKKINKYIFLLLVMSQTLNGIYEVIRMHTLSFFLLC